MQTSVKTVEVRLFKPDETKKDWCGFLKLLSQTPHHSGKEPRVKWEAWAKIYSYSLPDDDDLKTHLLVMAKGLPGVYILVDFDAGFSEMNRLSLQAERVEECLDAALVFCRSASGFVLTLGEEL